MVKSIFTDREPSDVLHYFERISQIPRESGNEAGIREYLLKFAQQHGLSSIVDRTGNVILKKKASIGAENTPWTALQGHMDMVCVKDEDSTHDFAKDPLILKIDGDDLTAEGTTLGADNGIAVAMALALLADEHAVHGPLEAIFTVSEETGLDGAFGLDIGDIQSRRLINLDSEEEGVFYIGCAGGGEVTGELPADYTSIPAGHEAYKLQLSGFIGGHSGAEIHTGRGNAIKSGVRFLKMVSRISDIGITSAAGGTKRNVIPNSLQCGFIAKAGLEQEITGLCAQLQQALAAELGSADPEAAIRVEKTESPARMVSFEQSRKVIDAIYLTPHGVDAMSHTIEGLVETSNNMAIFILDDDRFRFTASQRSSISSARDEIEERCCTAFEVCGAKTKRENKYPAWTPNADSALAKLCADFYREYTGKAPVITAIHAGLECGVINSKAPDMDSISIGPDLSGVHSTDERMSISSSERVYSYLKALLEEMTKA